MYTMFRESINRVAQKIKPLNFSDIVMLLS